MYKGRKSPATNGASIYEVKVESSSHNKLQQEISYSELNSRALESGVPFKWFPRAKHAGQSLRVGNLSGDPGASLWICLLSGAWKDHATGLGGGDLISLLAAKDSLSQHDAKRILISQLGVFQGTYLKPKVAKFERGRFATQLWRSSTCAMDTPVQHYLKSRGISNIPQSLRFHQAALHTPTQKKYVAMIAAITNAANSVPHAVHRTYLNGYQKAEIEPNRMMLGEIKGGAVRLAPVEERLALAEGIETALSFQQITGLPTWAVLSRCNYETFLIPDGVREIIIAADNDVSGLSAAHNAAAHWIQRGYKVEISGPPYGSKDWNDVLTSNSKNNETVRTLYD